MVPPKIPPPTGDLFAPLTPLQSALVEERGHSTRALPSRARSAVSRDGSRKFFRSLKDYLRLFMRILGNPKITLRIATAVISNAIVAGSHTRYFRVSPRGGSMAVMSRSALLLRLYVSCSFSNSLTWYALSLQRMTSSTNALLPHNVTYPYDQEVCGVL